MNGRIRKTIAPNSPVGKVRKDIYSSVMYSYEVALAHNFYLEAIALIESIIADRLESLCNEVTQSDVWSFKTLERLTDFVLGEKQSKQIPQEIRDVVKGIRQWKDGRNKALHEMAKIEDLGVDFNTKYAECRKIAVDGKKLFRRLDNEIRKWRRKK